MIHIIIGTKAQLIKMAPIMIRLRDRKIPYNFINTGQHKATMDDMLDDFGLKKPDLTLYEGPDITSITKMFFWSIRLIQKTIINKKIIFHNDENGIALVHGDTFSTLIGAIMGRIAGLKIGHVESGLRSFNIFHPFPEEITRILTFRLSNILFCPGQWAINNISFYNKKDKINTKANTMFDIIDISLKKERRQDHVPNIPYGIVSLHRYENIFIKNKFIKIIKILKMVSRQYHLLFILHPPTEKKLHQFNFYEELNSNLNIELRKRYKHSDFLSLLEKAEFIITDGGSLQEESMYIGIPCLLLRKTTERKEGLGENVLLSKFDESLIKNFLHNYIKYRKKPLKMNYSPSNIIIESIAGYA
jgi:UDP-N-acetylglucosamine 2-epimerase (non-hydrolysing)